MKLYKKIYTHYFWHEEEHGEFRPSKVSMSYTGAIENKHHLSKFSPFVALQPGIELHYKSDSYHLY